MKKLVALLLICFTVFSLSAVSFAATTDSITIDREMAKNNVSGDLVKLKLTGTPKTKDIKLEQDAVKYMIENKKQLFIDMKFIDVTIDPNAIKNTSEWKSRESGAEPLEMDITFVVKDMDKSGKYFSDGTYNTKGMYREPASTFTLKAELRAGGRHVADVKDFGGSIKVNDYYEWGTNWEVPTGGVPADKLRMYYFDLDTANHVTTYVWSLVGGSVDTTKKMVTANISKAGVYCLVGSKDHAATSSNTQNNNAVSQGAFSDITNHWAKDDILYLQSIGVINDKNINFYPKRNITRAEFAVYLVNALGLEENTSLAGKFKDLSTAKDYYKPALTAAYHGVVSGKSDTSFAPEDPITRQEMAVMFLRAMDKAGVSAGGNDMTKLNKFADAKSIATWAKDGAMAAVNTGLIGGTTDTTFSPSGKTTRGEAAAMISRFCKYINK
ncbi:MAG: S-layer homology domain-containing protein [Peptococcaceae bacterium]|nr:S-layer homology domain-containing protein [Peptococcaceae bacterium]